MRLRVFPVAAEGLPHFVDDFDRLKHLGIDIFAAEGTPALAVDDGTLRFATDPKGGQVYYLTAADGTLYYGAHLSAWEGASPRRVVAGEILGYVGASGNAQGTSPHLHFMVKPSGGVAVDPYRALLEVPPPRVVSSAGAVDQALPALPPSDLPAIPPLAGPVPPIPHGAPAPPASSGPSRARQAGGLLVSLIGAVALAGAARAAPRARGRAFA